MTHATRKSMTQVNPEEIQVCRNHGANSQFGNPQGLVGWLAGELMAVKNARLNQAALAVLDAAASDRILEIGFGHGRTLAALAGRAAFVAGVDPSSVMLRSARRRNRRGLGEGRVELHQATVTSIPYPGEHFDKALAVNCFQHWPAPDEGLREVHRVLRPGGTLLLGLRMHVAGAGRFTAPGFRERAVDAAERLVHEAGFADVKRVRREAGRALTCLVARR